MTEAMTARQTKAVLLQENRQLRGRMEELEATLRDIRSGEEYVGPTKAVAAARAGSRRALQESEVKYRRLFESAKDGILILDAESGKITDANPFILNLLSYSLGECAGKRLWEIGLFSDTEASKAAFRELQAKGYIRYEDLPLKTKDGRQMDVEFVSNLYKAGDRKVIQCNIRDITEHKARETSSRMFRALLDHASDAIEVLDPETLRYVDVNEAACRTLGYSRDELLSMRVPDVDPAMDELQLKKMGEDLQAQHPVVIETRHRRKDGSTFPVEVSISMVQGDRDYGVAVVRDITERKRAETVLHESEERLRAIFEGAIDGIALADVETRKLSVANPALCRMLGYSPEELVRLRVSDIHPRQELPYVLEQFDKQACGEIQVATDMPVKRKDGSVFYAEIKASAVNLGGRNYLVGIFRDITERKQAEAALNRANRTLGVLSACNLALVQASSEAELLRAVMDIIVEKGGYSLAEACYAEDDPGKSITLMAWSGREENYFWEGHPSWADTKEGQLPIAGAIRSGATQIRRDIASESKLKPWRDAALACGHISNIALPLSDGDSTFGGLSIYSSEAGSFDDEEVRLLEELTNDLAYGIVALRTRAEHDRHAIVLRQGLEQSIQTIADTVAARDPYTAGHQRRVADLATAIAREMELPEEQVNGIHLAGIIHDLGKIHIPSEILSKPGRISDAEYALIKEHPQSGYDILKDVKFPWPIADIILQHHERLDGSGYPQGLKDGDILLEARIIAVADVVEAMSSHRPYRPGLGVESALEEIERHQRKWYDPEVVDACLRLFREKGYTLPV